MTILRGTIQTQEHRFKLRSTYWAQGLLEFNLRSTVLAQGHFPNSWEPKNSFFRKSHLFDQIWYIKISKINSSSTFLQLSRPKREFWAARNWISLPFSFLFSGHLNKNHSAQTWVLVRGLQLTVSQDNLVGFNQLTILSGQGHISEFAVHTHKVILASSSTSLQNPLKRNKYPHPLIYMREIADDRKITVMLAHMTGRSSFLCPKAPYKVRH